MKNLYDILNVKHMATDKEITLAYRQLALKFHPDRTNITLKSYYEERFKDITFAYEILNDKEKRKRYDKYGVTDDTIVIDESIEVLKKFNSDFKEDFHDEKQENFCKALDRKGSEVKCVICEGSGVHVYEEGFFLSTEPCRACKGLGYIVIKPKRKGFFGSFVEDFSRTRDLNKPMSV